MNKRFFTLMAAVLLAGAPLCNEAFAAAYPITAEAPAADVVLANGIKFVIKTSSGYYKVANVENTSANATYATLAGDNAAAKDAAVFEIVNYQKSAFGTSFKLKVNGKIYAVKTGGVAIAEDTDKADIKTDFTPGTAAQADGSYKLKGLELKVVGDGSAISGLTINTQVQNYNADNLIDFNSTGTTFSFGADAVEGNIFAGLTPLTLSDVTGSFGAGTYFVKGTTDDIKAFTDAIAAVSGTPTTAQKTAIQNAAKKLTFAAVTTEKWGLNTSANGEGYKLAMVSGEAFYGDKALAFKNGAFTVKEADLLNNSGELEVTANVAVSTSVTNELVNIAAVKASASDTKTYVTTVNGNSQFKTIIAPTLGNNTYFAASEFLNEGAVSAYNVFFTSGSAVSAGEQPHEYGRYLSLVSNGSSYALHATSPDSTNVNAPLSQWIVTDFDGKYTLDLQNREWGQTLNLKLEATGNAGEYKIVGGTSATGSSIDNIVPSVTKNGVTTTLNELNKKTIKLIPTALSKNDGYLVLSKEDMSGKIALTFSGKDAQIGAQTYYMKLNDAKTAFEPTLKDSEAAYLNFSLNKPENTLVTDLIETPFAYLDKNGNIATDGVDSLSVPSYTVSYTKDDKTYYVTSSVFGVTQATSVPAGAQKVVLKKHISGNYGLGIKGTAKSAAGASSAAIKVVNGAFANTAKINALNNGDFAYAAVVLEDQNDYTTLEAVSRHATFENAYGAIAMQENKNGILEGILSAAPLTFWLDTADSEKATPSFYISVGIKAEEEAPATKADEEPVMRNFLYNPTDSAVVYNPGSATSSLVEKYFLEGSNKANLKAIFRPAALVAEDTLVSVVDGKEVTVVTKDADAAKGQVNGLDRFQYRIGLADPDVEGEYVVRSKATGAYLYSLNGRLGFGTKAQAYIFTLGEGDATANEAIAAESGVQVIGGEGVVTVQGAAGKVITVANILGQTIANQVATSDNVTIAAPAGVVVVAVDGEATKVVVK